ncbi:hypothetical protein BKA62DRAFT_817969 [Auriculariales sp. MPI-PUGE-AT-0066]|nr:hypothetical protein BKA62DRAFT_817969 [Auriculariales sp. MPI-PUGE-AT-0066]
MLFRTLIAFTVMATAVGAQKAISGKGTIVVTSETVEAACLMQNGKVTTNSTACGTFTATAQGKTVWDGASVDAGAGTCGWNLTDRAAPLTCGTDVDKKLGFFSFNDKLATQELQTQWFLNSTADETVKLLFWQGMHQDTAELTWVPA